MQKRDFRMQDYINILSKQLNLSQYQENKLKTQSYKYDVTRLQKRGGVLYAPYVTHGLFDWCIKFLFGRPADLIGPKYVLLRAQRKVKFCANGYHCVRVGRHRYYANAFGDIVSKNEFLKNTKH